MFASNPSRATLMARRLLALSSTTKIPAVSWLELGVVASAIADVMVLIDDGLRGQPHRTVLTIPSLAGQPSEAICLDTRSELHPFAGIEGQPNLVPCEAMDHGLG